MNNYNIIITLKSSLNMNWINILRVLGNNYYYGWLQKLLLQWFIILFYCRRKKASSQSYSPSKVDKCTVYLCQNWSTNLEALLLKEKGREKTCKMLMLSLMISWQSLKTNQPKCKLQVNLYFSFVIQGVFTQSFRYQCSSGLSWQEGGSIIVMVYSKLSEKMY